MEQEDKDFFPDNYRELVRTVVFKAESDWKREAQREPFKRGRYKETRRWWGTRTELVEFFNSTALDWYYSVFDLEVSPEEGYRNMCDYLLRIEKECKCR